MLSHADVIHFGNEFQEPSPANVNLDCNDCDEKFSDERALIQHRVVVHRDLDQFTPGNYFWLVIWLSHLPTQEHSFCFLNPSVNHQ